MGGFRYKHGDRPLDGYTIQRAAGRGGFGEVYYALSDSGREVALKMISGYEQIELRGVGNCMNLKSPHLVSIFDVKHNAEGTPFVIMEFVNGPSLRQLLDESPAGLGTQKAAFFLREMTKGLSYLHDCGIVHRDLKPGNVFYENGYVKIGDYGLSKAMSASPHSGQTITVGTVHYMAPEIGMGKYDQSIDIYALGAVLFELLTGQVPFLGGSPSEILMKHMTAEVNVSNIEEPFATVIKTCMAKDPAQRYKNVQEVVEGVFGAEHIRESVSCFAPESLSMVAQRVANRIAGGGSSDTPPPIPGGAPVATLDAPRGPNDVWGRMGDYVDYAGDRLSQLGGRMADVGGRLLPNASRSKNGKPERAGPVAELDAAVANDPLTKRQRRILGLSLTLVIATAAAVISPFRDPDGLMIAWFSAFTMLFGATAGVLVTRHRIIPQLARESTTVQRLATGGIATAALLLLSLPVMAAAGRVGENVGMVALVAIIPLFFMDWITFASPQRKERVSFGHAVTAAIFGFVLSLFLLHDNAGLAIGILAGISLLVQVYSPWDPIRAGASATSDDDDDDDEEGDDEDDSAADADPARTWGALSSNQEKLGSSSVLAIDPNASTLRPVADFPATAVQRVPGFMRWFWLAGFVGLFPTGIMLAAYPAMVGNVRRDEESFFIAFGVGSILLGLLAFVKSFQKRHKGWGSYLVRPLLFWACVQSVLASACYLGIANPRNEEAMLCLFLIIFPVVLLPVIAFVRFSSNDADAPVLPPPIPVASPDFQGVPPMPATGHTPPAILASDRAGVRASDRAAAEIRRERRRLQRALDARSPEPGMWKYHALASLGYPLLIAAGLVGAAMSIDVPGLIGMSIEHRHPDRAVVPSPALIRLGGTALTWAGMFAACVLIMVARRPAGAMHILRAALGVAGIGGSLGTLYAAASKHGGLAAARRAVTDLSSPNAIIEQYLGNWDGMPLSFAAVILTVATIVLVWPSPKPRPAVPAETQAKEKAQ